MLHLGIAVVIYCIRMNFGGAETEIEMEIVCFKGSAHLLHLGSFKIMSSCMLLQGKFTGCAWEKISIC